jgi:peptidoglycan/LPS O-acetylase OafA/YrhL
MLYVSIGWFMYCQDPIVHYSNFISTLWPSIIFAGLILNVCANPKSIIKLQNPALNYLGSISYGIYMYHPLIIFSVLWFLSRYYASLLHAPFAFAIVSAFSISLTIFVATLSYYYFETRFFKYKFTVANRKLEKPLVPEGV